ncbi:centrosomal protein kizuna isoform X2 [Protopterus annectens]|uniref:centrosomal protein kizuna isoform X2 n=1 Tax=Protopterus annectens TaxID=7888 RepID=UPI001CFA0ED7|nr:centrosomal protein kizuna isoform X2 [Protopterus annectens]
MAVCGTEFFDKVGRLQRKMHENERKRLDLEKRLFETSDQRLSKLKQIKLKSYLRDICEREKKALLRNREIQKDFVRVKAHISALSANTDKLQQMKREFEKEIERRMAAWKNQMMKGQKSETTSDQTFQLSRSVDTDKEADLSRELYHPATIFMGHQMSFSSSNEQLSTLQSSYQPTESLLTPHPSSQKQTAESSPVTDSSILKAKSNVILLNKSDKKDGTVYLQNRKKMPLTSTVLYENELPHASGTETSNTVINSSLSPSKITDKLCSMLPPQKQGLTLQNGTNDLKAAVFDAERKAEPEHFELIQNALVPPVTSSLSCFHKSQPRIADQTCVQNNGQLMQNLEDLKNQSFDMDSEPTVSVSENELEEQQSSTIPQKKISGKSDPFNLLKPACTIQEVRSLSKAESNSTVKSTLYVNAVPSDVASDSSMEEYTISHESFFHLLQLVEDTVKKVGSAHLYQAKTTNREDLKELIRLCNQENLDGEDLEACGVFILQQLQKLSQNTLNGCLLPDQVLMNNWNSKDESQVRSALSSDAVMLWDRWYRHAVFLAENHILSRAEAATLFGPLLISTYSKNSKEVVELLKNIIPEEAEESLSVRSDSSCSLPSILNDGGEIKQARPALWLYTTVANEQGGTCSDDEEDNIEGSSDSSVTKNVPITETKAYQLLKQSAVQQRHHLTKDDEKESSELELVGTEKCNISAAAGKKENIPSEISSSSTQESSPQRHNGFTSGISAMKSKAFWGESDDSNSDIEAALCPQMASKEDSDDFYD